MINILIKSEYDKLTNSEKNLSEWFLKNDDWNRKTIIEIAKLSYNNISTINRFSKKLGFHGFKDMKSIDSFQEKRYKSNLVHKNNLNDIIYSFQETSKRISDNEIDLIAKKIIKYKNIFFYGESFTYNLSKYISRKFSKINYESRDYNVASDLSIILPKEDSIHIFISNSGKNPNIKKACEKIHFSNKKQFLVSVSSQHKTNIDDMVNSKLSGDFYSSVDQDHFELPFIAQYVSQYILDIIFNKVYEIKKDIHEKQIKAIAKIKDK